MFKNNIIRLLVYMSLLKLKLALKYKILYFLFLYMIVSFIIIYNI